MFLTTFDYFGWLLRFFEKSSLFFTFLKPDGQKSLSPAYCQLGLGPKTKFFFLKTHFFGQFRPVLTTLVEAKKINFFWKKSFFSLFWLPTAENRKVVRLLAAGPGAQGNFFSSSKLIFLGSSDQFWPLWLRKKKVEIFFEKSHFFSLFWPPMAENR